MKVAVVGTRRFKDESRFNREMDGFLRSWGSFTVVTGDAVGPDLMAVKWANLRQLPVPEVYPANWADLSHPDAVIKTKNGRKYDALAGKRRNTEIVAACDRLIAFWDGRSRGTEDVIYKARGAGKPVYLISTGGV